MYFAASAAGFVAGGGLIFAIGSQNAFVLRQGLQRHHVGRVVLICALGDITLILAGVGGAGVVVQQWPGLLQVLRWAGAAFLATYGLMAARRAWQGTGALDPTADQQKGARHVILACLAFTFLNPHVYLDTMVLLGSLSTRYAGLARWAFALGACCASVLWFTSLGYGARLLLPVFRNPRAWRVLDALIAMFMLVLALGLVFHRG
ncbi:amino acid transporter [Pigmentiphaga aceris]|uniref:Amino acid transporter n=1 Tax=Pigmentiphaga aceris TaxID=1940612 RepID=A0A5C0AVD7_9BURK|nr:LysE/ArgO family amino acid transporter [Pigmentiphaga aceris]QEI06155.1 amino acid transporter [Pigmentiphaga aceris]